MFEENSAMSKPQIDLTGKIVLITGASRGIGRATALRLGEAGARVAVNYRSSETEADEVVRAIGEERAFAVKADVANPKEVEMMVNAVLDRCGRIDILVNNAALYHEDNPFEGEDYEWWQRSWQRSFEVNLFGAANAAFLAMRSMRKNGGGKIINVSSRAAWRGEIEFADYGASKAGLVNLTRSIARACAKDNIIASCVTPGFVDTGQPYLREHYDEIVAQIPLRRVASVEDVASAILFLASPMADYLNGVAIDINGGSWFQ
jgi:NAD(P)-dependent dehydrogenase (short-subunit alcohol dehydrogenase family)